MHLNITTFIFKHFVGIMHIFDQKFLALKEVINFFLNSGLWKWHKWVYLNFQVQCSKSKIYSELKRMTITIVNFTTISGHFFAKYMSIFHKTEVQTVILVYLKGLKSDWFKGYNTKCIYFHFCFFAILYKNTPLRFLRFLHFFGLCHNYCTN